MHHTDLIALIAVGLTVAFIGGLVATRLKLPLIVGYLGAGVAIGPFTPGFVGDSDLATQLEFESAYQGLAATTDDFKEGVYSFLEKRDPHFTGK